MVPQALQEKNEEEQLFFQISGKKRMITLICFVQWIVSMASAGNITHQNEVLLKRFHLTLGSEIIQKKMQLQFHIISNTSINEKCVKYLQKLSDPGRTANEETATHQGARPSKPGEGEEMKEEGVKEDFKAGSEDVRDNGGEEDEVVRKLPARKMSLTRRQSRDLIKKKTSFEEQVLFF